MMYRCSILTNYNSVNDYRPVKRVYSPVKFFHNLLLHMENNFIIAILITVLFCLAKFIEMRFIEKQMKPLKFLVRDACIVFMSGVAATFIFFNMDSTMTDFFNVVTETKSVPQGGAAEVFTDAPGF